MQKSLIFIVDDMPKNLQLMEIILQNKGYDVAQASNGREALEKLKKMKPDLILLDIMMPEMDGFETCETIKSDKKLADIPVIFLTGKSDPQDVVNGLKLGAVDYIAKPFNTTELLLRVETQVELKQSRDQLKEKNQELQQLNSSKDKFFSIISHDLKSPFQGLIGLTELLQEDIEEMSKEEILKFSSMIHESSRNLLNLLENLLEWSVLERDKHTFQGQQTDLHPIIEKNIQLFEANAGKKDIILENNISKPIKAWCDRNMIDTVIRNLISNALKYTPVGGKITLEANSDDTHATIRIIDTGVGMDQDTQNSLFQMENMKSQPGTKNEKGTGLGLLICKELIEKNSGDISVESTPGEGSVFSIHLPLNAVDDSNAPAEQTDNHGQ